MVPPSRRSTIRTSSVNRTSLTRSPGRPSEVFIPSLQQSWLVFNDEPLDAAQLNRRESKVTRQRNRGQPELRCVIITVDVDVRRLVQVMADEVESIRAASK